MLPVIIEIAARTDVIIYDPQADQIIPQDRATPTVPSAPPAAGWLSK
jgi:hypothetical protein